MRSTIHTVLASAALMAATVLASNSAMAETTTLNVPFSFMAAGKICPAGHYTVKENPIGTFVTLTNRDSSRVFTWLLSPGSPDRDAAKVVLKFDVTGSTHLLRTVQVGPMTTSVLDKNADTNEYRSAELAVHPGQ